MVRRNLKPGLSPKVRGKETVGVGDGHESGLNEVAESLGRPTGGGVAVLNTCKLEELLRDRGGDDTSTTRSRDETGDGGTALAGNLEEQTDLTPFNGGNGTCTSTYLRGDGVGLTENGTPVTTADGDNAQLSEDDSATNSGSDFLRALDTETDMAIIVTDDNERLETSTLTSTGLLLDRHNLHDLVLELGQEEIDDLVLLDGKGEQVDVLDGLDLAILYETTQLGDGSPDDSTYSVSVQFCVVRFQSSSNPHHSFLSSSLRPRPLPLPRSPRRPRLSPRPPRPKPPRPNDQQLSIRIPSTEMVKHSTTYRALRPKNEKQMENQNLIRKPVFPEVKAILTETWSAICCK